MPVSRTSEDIAIECLSNDEHVSANSFINLGGFCGRPIGQWFRVYQQINVVAPCPVTVPHQSHPFSPPSPPLTENKMTLPSDVPRTQRIVQAFFFAPLFCLTISGVVFGFAGKPCLGIGRWEDN